MSWESREGGEPFSLPSPPFALEFSLPNCGNGLPTNPRKMGEVRDDRTANDAVLMIAYRYVEMFRFGAIRRENVVLKNPLNIGESEISSERYREVSGIDQIYPNFQLIQLVTMRFLRARPIKVDPLVEDQLGLLVRNSP